LKASVQSECNTRVRMRAYWCAVFVDCVCVRVNVREWNINKIFVRKRQDYGYICIYAGHTRNVNKKTALCEVRICRFEI